MSKKEFNMYDDFYFLFPKKKDLCVNIDPSSVAFSSLQMEYCFYSPCDNFFQDNSFDLINILEAYYKGIINGRVSFVRSDYYTMGLIGSKIDHENILMIIKKNIDKKMRIFNTLNNYDKKIRRGNKDIGTMCASLFVSPKERFNPNPINWNILKNTTKIFLNNLRSISAYNHHVLGYFWVILKDINDLPYLHIHFYVKTKNFNSKLGEYINYCWDNAIKKKGDYNGGVLHFTSKNEYLNGYLFKMEGNSHNRIIMGISNRLKNTDGNGFLMTNDLNNFPSGDYKHFSEKYFTKYIYSLAKESFSCERKYRVLGMTST